MSTRGNLPMGEVTVPSNNPLWVSPATVEIQLTSKQHYYIQNIVRNLDHPHYKNSPEIHRVLGITGRANDINTLRLSGTKYRERNGDPGTEQDLPDSASISKAYILPNLRRLIVLNAPIFLWCHLIPIQLTELDCRVDRHVDRGIPLIMVSDFMKVVSQLNRLEVLKVGNALTSSKGQAKPQRINFPRLRKLHVALDSAETYRRFMSYFPPLGPSVQLHLETNLEEGQSRSCMSFGNTFELGFYRLNFIVEGFRHLVVEGWFENGLEQDITEPSFRANLKLRATTVADEVTVFCNELKLDATDPDNKTMKPDTVKILDLHWRAVIWDRFTMLDELDGAFLNGSQSIRRGIEQVNVISWPWRVFVNHLLKQRPRVYWSNLRRLVFFQFQVPVEAEFLQALENAANMDHRKKLEEISIANKTIYRMKDGRFHLASVNQRHG